MTATSARPSPDALTAPRATVDQELAARVARGWNLVHRVVGTRHALDELIDDVRAWQLHSRDLLRRRFVARSVADSMGAPIDPIPPLADATYRAREAKQAPARLRSVRDTAEHEIRMLEVLRTTLPKRPAPEPAALTATGSAMQDAVALVAVHDSGTVTAVRRVLTRLRGTRPVVVGSHPGEARSLVTAAERALPPDGQAVVVVEAVPGGAADPDSVFAAGFAAGALGADNVVLVHSHGLVLPHEMGDLRHVELGDGHGWELALARAVGGASPSVAGPGAPAAARSAKASQSTAPPRRRPPRVASRR